MRGRSPCRCRCVHGVVGPAPHRPRRAGLLSRLAELPAPLRSAPRRSIVAVRPGPRRGSPARWRPPGFDHDLLARFARERSLRSGGHRRDARVADRRRRERRGARRRRRTVPVADRPQAPAPRAAPTPRRAAAVSWTAGYDAVEPVLIYNVDGYQAQALATTSQARRSPIADGTGVDALLAAARRAHPEVRWEPVDVPVRRRADRAGVRRHDRLRGRAVERRRGRRATSTSTSTSRSRPAAPRARVGGRARRAALRDELDAFIARLRRDGTLARLAERYFAHARQVDARRRRRLPGAHQAAAAAYWRPDFDEAQEATGIEWRLLAAVAYQESQWDPAARRAKPACAA